MAESDKNCFKCGQCSSQFSYRKNLQAHERKKHGKPASMMLDRTFVCDQCCEKFIYLKHLNAHKVQKHGTSKVQKLHVCRKCGMKFSNLNNLRSHETYKHNAGKKSVTFRCIECDACFSNQILLKVHVRSHHNDLKTSPEPACSFCSFTATRALLYEHYKEMHAKEIVIKSEKFRNFSEFCDWKKRVEKETSAKFVTERGYSVSTSSMKYYFFVCHHTGYYVPTGCEQRKLKLQDTKKMNAFCPSRMKVIELQDGTCMVDFIQTHIGHENELSHFVSKSTEREYIATQIADEKPFEGILNEMRSLVPGSSLDRLHLLTRKDLHNIKKSCNLKERFDSGSSSDSSSHFPKKDLYNIEKNFDLNAEGICHENDATGIDCWVNRCTENDKKSILFYKPQGVAPISDEANLTKEDVILVIMNQMQGEMLGKYGRERIIIDETSEIWEDGCNLTIIMTIDEVDQGIPVAFLISNRCDESVLTEFFDCVKDNIGIIETKVFVSGVEDSFFNAWVRSMGQPGRRLFSAWQVDKAWTRNLRLKIKVTAKQAEIRKCLRLLLRESDEDTFQETLSNLVKFMSQDPETLEFGEYFTNYYLKAPRFWARCYRDDCGLNGNAHLQRMHSMLSYIYQKGKEIKRLDKALFALTALARDRVFEALIASHKGKITKKLSNLRKRHDTSEGMETRLITENGGKWLIPSADNGKIFKLKKVREEPCSCKLECNKCQTCIHKYSCTCRDSSTFGNMCEHIHLLCRYVAKNKQVSDGASKVSESKQVSDEASKMSENKQVSDEASKMSENKQVSDEASEMSENKQVSDEASEMSEKQVSDEASEMSENKQVSDEASEMSENKQVSDEASEMCVEDSYIYEEVVELETNDILPGLNENTTSPNEPLECMKEKLMKRFCDILHSISSIEEVNIVDEALASICAN